MPEHHDQNYIYPCARCAKMTTRVNYTLELPSCSTACDKLLNAIAYVTPSNQQEIDE